jgi:hypothetical protein
MNPKSNIQNPTSSSIQRKENEHGLPVPNPNSMNYNQNKGILVKMAVYIAAKRETLAETKAFQPHAEASRARILAEALRNQRL